MTHLTDHFTLAELTRSTTALRKGIPNKPSADEVRALTLLCQKILEPVRAHYGKPVIVTSGYRAPRVNIAVGGSGSSQHCLGQAVDMTVQGVDNLSVARWIQQNLSFDQLILEFPPGGWVHVSYSSDRLREQVLTAKRKGGRTIYLQGLSL